MPRMELGNSPRESLFNYVTIVQGPKGDKGDPGFGGGSSGDIDGGTPGDQAVGDIDGGSPG